MRFDWKAILAGIAVSVALNLLSQVFLVLALVTYGTIGEATLGEGGYYHYISYPLASFLLMLVMLAGGYVAARMATNRPYFHALLVGAIVAFMNLLTSVSAGVLTWMTPVFVVITLVSAPMGAHLRKKQRQMGGQDDNKQ